MSRMQNVLLKFLSGIITFFVIYLAVSSMIFMDFASSLLPGWHTTIYPFGGVLQLTIMIMVFATVAILIFRYVLKLLTYLIISYKGR